MEASWWNVKQKRVAIQMRFFADIWWQQLGTADDDVNMLYGGPTLLESNIVREIFVVDASINKVKTCVFINL